ncbi:hypothetical protein C2G38_2196467 [Gigaspora rosea]|uniref:Uncharacterized protein n=1 Tax=Gigaspora rosea TaxID=44941 RepID=A0A397V1Z2_9GLOM|nr:hypothetical protein C2G38_2196467 [Gigaspora rosea]
MKPNQKKQKENEETNNSIPLVETLKQNYLKPVYNKHIAIIKLEFFEKPVALIVDEMTNECARMPVLGHILYSVYTSEFYMDESTRTLLVSNLSGPPEGSTQDAIPATQL